jgi:2-phosphoglycerate kinase
VGIAADEWTVLLLGGAAGAGKSTSAASIASRLSVSWLSADAIWHTLKAATSPATHPALHLFEPSDADIEVGAEHLLRLHVESAEAMSASLDAFVDWQLRECAPLVLEGAWITPEFAAGQIEMRPGAVSAVFVCEREFDAVLDAMMARAGHPPRTNRRMRLTQMSWMYGEWMRAECARLSLPVVEARPRDTLVERVLAAARHQAATP